MVEVPPPRLFLPGLFFLGVAIALIAFSDGTVEAAFAPAAVLAVMFMAFRENELTRARNMENTIRDHASRVASNLAALRREGGVSGVLELIGVVADGRSQRVRSIVVEAVDSSLAMVKELTPRDTLSFMFDAARGFRSLRQVQVRTASPQLAISTASSFIVGRAGSRRQLKLSGDFELPVTTDATRVDDVAAWGRMFSGVVVSSLSLGGMATLTPPSSLGREEAVVAEAHRRLRIVDDDVASLLRSCAQPEMRAAATTATTATPGAMVLRRLEAVLRPPEIPEALRLDAGEVEEGAEIGREPFASLHRGRCRGRDVVIRVSGCGRCCDDAVGTAAAWLVIVIPYWRVHRCM
jgi:hypothetical protein